MKKFSFKLDLTTLQALGELLQKVKANTKNALVDLWLSEMCVELQMRIVKLRHKTGRAITVAFTLTELLAIQVASEDYFEMHPMTPQMQLLKVSLLDCINSKIRLN